MGMWMLVDLKMLNIASGEFSRYVCGQHHSLILCTLNVNICEAHLKAFSFFK